MEMANVNIYIKMCNYYVCVTIHAVACAGFFFFKRGVLQLGACRPVELSLFPKHGGGVSGSMTDLSDEGKTNRNQRGRGGWSLNPLTPPPPPARVRACVHVYFLYVCLWVCAAIIERTFNDSTQRFHKTINKNQRTIICHQKPNNIFFNA